MSQSALNVLGQDFIFPNKIEGVPAQLSDFAGLQIHNFTTSDGVKLAYWEAGEGGPFVILPGWSGHGLSGLRVADASIMPTVVCVNTNPAAIMIGEKAAGLIRGN